MEKKATIISLVFVGIVVICAVALIIFSGITANDYNYVQLEVNPRVEFIVDKNFKVVSFRPLNEDAEIILSDVNYKGMDIENASTSFLDICAQTGYIDVDGENNAVNITVIDGITQALDVHVTQKINDYLRKNEIICAVIENYEDRSMFDEKKENNTCCTNKFKLIKTLNEYDESLTLEKLNKLSEVKLINMVEDIHSTDRSSPSREDKSTKENLLNKNKEKYENHKKKITDKSQQEFAEKFEKHQNSGAKKYQENFTKNYDEWKENLS